MAEFVESLELQDLHKDEGSEKEKEEYRLLFQRFNGRTISIDEYLEAFKHKN